jgi:hypothetical protein
MARQLRAASVAAMLTTRNQITVDSRFNGLPGIALGGYSSGLIATAFNARAVEVKLRRPVPIGRELELVHTAAGIDLRDGETVLATGAATRVAIEAPQAPTLAQATAASRRFPGHHQHPYGDCFACGPGRAEGDGLRIFPGTVKGRSIIAAPWIPTDASGNDGRVGLDLIWSAFDCVQLWALMIHQPGASGERAVTVALAGTARNHVRPGLPHVLMGWPLPRQGNSLRAGAALIGPDGELCAIGMQTAVIAKWGVPLDLVEQRPAAGGAS